MAHIDQPLLSRRVHMRWLVIALALALVATACGGGDTTTAAPAPQPTEASEPTTAPEPEPEPTTAPEPEPEPEPTTAPEPEPEPEPTTTSEPELSAAELSQAFATNNDVLLPANTTLNFYEENADGSTTVGGTVDGPPPPGLAGLAADAGWEVLVQEFGSEWAALFRGGICLLIYANYTTAQDPDYWIYVAVANGITPEECSTRFPAFRTAFEGIGSPL